jgi:hypothetical protein
MVPQDKAGNDPAVKRLSVKARARRHLRAAVTKDK